MYLFFVEAIFAIFTPFGIHILVIILDKRTNNSKLFFRKHTLVLDFGITVTFNEKFG